MFRLRMRTTKKFMDTRQCTRCLLIKTLDEFPKYYNDGKTLHRKYCTSCKSNDSSKWYYSHQERVSERRKYLHDYYRNLVIEGYGGKCACCGESEPMFLSVHHVNGGGGKARKNGTERTGKPLYYKIVKLGFPEEYQLLCHNCNMADGIYGICPHKYVGYDERKKRETEEWLHGLRH